MDAGLKQFAEAYAKDNGLSDMEAGVLVGALSAKAIEKLDEYKKFVLTLNSVAPQLIHYVQLAGKTEGE